MAPGGQAFGQPVLGQEPVDIFTTRADGLYFDMMLDGVNWTDVTADTRGEMGAALDYGMPDGKATTRVAKTGSLKFFLDNSGVYNFGHKVGYYSPVNVNCRTGFAQNIPVRLVYVNGGINYYKFNGRLSVIDPFAGSNRAMYTACTAVDYMDDLARAQLTGLPTQVNCFANDVLGKVVAAMVRKPTLTTMDLGSVLFPWGLVGGTGGIVNGMQEAQRATVSEFGYLYVKGNTTGGGELHLENQNARIGKTSLFTLNNTMQENPAGINPLDVTTDIVDVINNVQVTYHPRKVDGQVGLEVILYAALVTATTALKVPAGTTVTLQAPYRDPNALTTVASGQIAGTSMLAPVATTDYTANAAADGSGANLTGSVSIVATLGSTGATLAISNASGSDAYMTKLQLRGVGLYDYQQQIAIAMDVSSETAYGVNTLLLDLPYVSDAASAQSIANEILNAWKNPFGFAKSVTFQCDTPDKLAAACVREIGDRITIAETVTGVEADFFIAGVQWDMRASKWITCTWRLTPASFTPTGWRLGVPGASELGVTTILS